MWVYILLASVLVTMFLLTDLLISRTLLWTTVRMHEVERVHIISLEDTPYLAESVASQLHVPNVTLWPAVNTSIAEKEAHLPLYARYVLDHGHHNLFQLGSSAALGCLLSHMQVCPFPGSLLVLSRLVLGFRSHMQFVSLVRVYQCVEGGLTSTRAGVA